MQNVNRNPAVLYKVDNALSTISKGYKIKVEIYETVDKIAQVSAYSFHPDKTTLLKRIKNWFIELFYGSTTVLVKVNGESSALYMRVDDLSKVLKIPAREIQGKAITGDLSEFLAAHQVKQTIGKIEKFAEKGGGVWSNIEQNSLKNIIHEVGYRNVFKIVDHHQFDSKLILSTLLNVGTELSNHLPKVQKELRSPAYEYEIELPNIYIWKIENFKKTKINLIDLSVTNEDLLIKTINEIGKVAKSHGIRWTSIEEKLTEELVKKIGYENTLKALNHNQFKEKLMIEAFIQVGKQLTINSSNAPMLPNGYTIQINSYGIFFSKIENYKKTKINLKNLIVTTEELPKPIPVAPATDHEDVQSILQPVKGPFVQSLPIDTKKQETLTLLNQFTQLFQSTPDLAKSEFEVMIDLLGVESKNVKHLTALANRVGYANMNNVMDSLDIEFKKIMMNTFIKIGRKLSAPAILDSIFSKFRLVYVGRKKEKNKIKSYAFAINKKDIFISQEKMGNGSFKTVSNAIKLNNISECFVRIKIKNPKTNLINFDQTSVAIKELKKEAQFLELFHKNKKELGGSCIVLPFSCEIKSKKKKLIFFQKKYDGDGNNLFKAPATQQLFALRDIALGLNFIHNLGYVHMDVKPPNFLLEGKIGQNTCVKGKVSDFGMTTKSGDPLIGGTFIYLPPEAITNNGKLVEFKLNCKANKQIDAFSLGITILEIIDSRPKEILGLLTQDQIDKEIDCYKKKIKNTNSNDEADIKLTLLNLAADLLRCNPQERMSCLGAAERLDQFAQVFEDD